MTKDIIYPEEWKEMDWAKQCEELEKLRKLTQDWEKEGYCDCNEWCPKCGKKIKKLKPMVYEDIKA